MLDTTVLVDSLRSHPPARAYLSGLREARGSVLTRFEIRAGKEGSSPEVEWLLREIIWEPVTEEISDRAGSFAREYRASDPSIDPIDFLIAATADVLGYEFATRNVRHFPMFSGLRAPY